MNKVDRWLLPDGIEELLPVDSGKIESLRRRIVDLFRSWGYDYVIPPMVEFTDSLLTGSGQDIDLLTFKLTDQMSGRMMGIRADITPQAARMDAHSLRRDGINRLCYAGHVMYTKPKTPLASRTPIQAGVELFGEAGLDADIEVISLLLETLKAANLARQYIDIGHAGIYRSLAEYAELSRDQELAFFDLLQAKASNEIAAWVNDHVKDQQTANWLLALPRLSGDSSILATARESFADAPAEVTAALDELEIIAKVLPERYPDAQLYFDLSELRGYHYYTGLIFGAFAPGLGEAIANGGRYDHIGEAFGRARPATGFAVDLTAINRLNGSESPAQPGIFAAADSSRSQWQMIQKLRGKGERVVSGLSGQAAPLDYQYCDRQLIDVDGEWVVKPL